MNTFLYIKSFLIFCLILLLGLRANSFAFQNKTKTNKKNAKQIDRQSQSIKTDSLKIKQNDSINFINMKLLQDSIAKSKVIFSKDTSDSNQTNIKLTSTKSDSTNNDESSSIDTNIVYKASDTATYFFKQKKMRIKGKSNVDYKTQNLQAEIIEIDFNTYMLDAKYDLDSNHKMIGIPKFKEAGTEYAGQRIRYNFKTNKGVISQGETKLSEGFYYGEEIKRVSQSELFVKDGKYTTCDAPHPHYYFGSSKMKLIAQDKLLLDPLTFYVEDLPIFTLPFGLYFPMQSGRRSGLIVPTFFFSNNRGVVFENLGFYWAASDYFDAQITSNIYSKGGYLVNTQSQWKIGDELSGSANISYGKTRYNPDDKFTQAWKLALKHNQAITPQQKLTLNLDFSSQDFNRNTTTVLSDRIKQNITSNASYSINFDNSQALSLSFNADQNIITNESKQSYNINYSIPTFNVFKLWDKDFTFQINPRLNYNVNKNLNPKYSDTASIQQDKFLNTEQKSINLSPTLSYSFPKLFNVINVTPSYSLQANMYFRSLTKTYNSTTKEFDKTYEDKPFSLEYWSTFSVGMNTKIFGVSDKNNKLFYFLDPNWLGAKALRHTMEPQISFSYTPDYSNNTNFYGRTYDSIRKSNVLYSRFEDEGGSHAPTMKSQSMSFALNNKFESKTKQNDTLDNNNELLNWNLNSSYNFVADSLKLSDLNMNFRIPALNVLNLNANSSFTFYDEAADTTGTYTGIKPIYRTINTYLLEANKGLMRMKNFSLSMSYSFGSENVSNNANSNTANKPKDSSNVADRFQARSEAEVDHDLFGDFSDGFSPFKMPWKLGFSLSYSYAKPIAALSETERLTMNFNSELGITATWKLKLDGYYDLIENKIQSATVNLTKDLHCWDLSFRWYPIGFNQGFYLRFGIKSSQLKDLKIEKQNSALTN